MSLSVSEGESHGPLVMGVSWMLTSLSFFAVALRFYVRVRVNQFLGTDDWIMLAAMIFQLFFQAFLTKAYLLGFGEPDASLSYSAATQILMWDYITVTPGIMVSILSRVSSAILLTRIFGREVWFKYFVVGFTALQSLCGLLLIIFVWVQVTPVQGLWDMTLPARRWDPSVKEDFAMFTQSLFTLSDLAYILLPCAIIWKLNMPMRRKISIVILMAASLFTMAASIVKTVTTQTSTAAQSQKEASIAFMWTAVEQNMVIIMSCVPPLRSVTKLNPRLFRALRLTDGDPDSLPLSYGKKTNGGWSVKAGKRISGGQYYDMDLDGHTTTVPRVAGGCRDSSHPFQDRSRNSEAPSVLPKAGWKDGIMKTNEVTIQYDQRDRAWTTMDA